MVKREINTNIATGDTVEVAITKFMKYYSPISTVFIVEAISRYADEVIQASEVLKKDMQRHIINPNLWIKIAKDWKEAEKVRLNKE
jgi:hypothetical protein